MGRWTDRERFSRTSLVRGSTLYILKEKDPGLWDLERVKVAIAIQGAGLWWGVHLGSGHGARPQATIFQHPSSLQVQRAEYVQCPHLTFRAHPQPLGAFPRAKYPLPSGAVGSSLT